MSTANKTGRKLGGLLSVALGMLLGGLPIERAEPAPTGGVVSAGEATIDQSQANTTLIQQQSHSTVIDWQTFNVGASESVIFNQPSSSASALNRIHDQQPSQIFGRIQANGRIYLMNPNGIVFGSSAQVNVGSLFATTLSISNDEFMKGNYNFQRQGEHVGAVINRGMIQAASGGFVGLVGNRVENTGHIVASMGHIQMSSAEAVTLDFDGDGLIQFQISGSVTSNPSGSDSAVLNTGTLNADGGQVILSAQAASGVFTNAVNNQGVISANRVSQSGGTIRLLGTGGTVRNTGTLRANNAGKVLVRSDGMSIIDNGSIVTATGPEGAIGGTVHILGETVALLGDAHVDVSGDAGGGEILIGGDYQGKGEVMNAQYTFIDDGVKIAADATQLGDGGKVIVWADDFTVFYGSISAKGGPQGGDGGFVEVSGKNMLEFNPTLITLTAEQGMTGTLLLDPRNIIIQNSGPNSNISFSGGSPDIAESTGDNAILTTASIETALLSADVIIRTGDSGAQAGNITVANRIDPPGNSNDLTLEADNNIIFSATTGFDFTTNSSTGNLTLTADADGNGTGTIDTNSATITMNGGNLTMSAADDITINSAITTNGGNVTLNADSDQVGTGEAIFSAGGDIITNGGTIDITASDIGLQPGAQLNAGTGNVILRTSRSGITVALGDGATGVFELGTAALDRITGVTLEVRSTQTDNFELSSVAPANITNLTLVTGGDINDDGGGTADVTVSGTLTLAAGGSIGNLNGGINTDAPTITVTQGVSGVSLFDQGNVTTTLNVTTGGNGDVTFTNNDNDILIGSITTGTGTVTLETDSAGSINPTNGDAGADITGGSIVMNAFGGIGNTTQLDINAPSVSAQTDNNAISLHNLDTDAVNITNLETSTSAPITYQSTSDSTFTSVTTNGGSFTHTGSAGSTFTSVITGGGSFTHTGGASSTLTTVTTGGGALNVSDVDGVTINGQVTTSGGVVTIDADTDNTGAGNFLVDANDSLDSGNAAITITAHSPGVGADGSINSGTATTTLLPSAAGDTIGLGSGSGTFSLGTGGLDRITASELIIGVASGGEASGAIQVGGISTAIANIGALTLRTGSTIDGNGGGTNLALGAGDTLTLTSGGAIGGSVTLTVDVPTLTVTTTGGNSVTMTDAGTSATTVSILTGGGGDISFTQSANSMTVAAAGISTTGNVTLNSQDGITPNGNIASTSNGTISIDADTNNDGTGSFELTGGVDVTSVNGNITITAFDVGIGSGSVIDAGTGNVTLLPSTLNATIGLGNATAGADFALADAAIDRISGTTLTIGDLTTNSGALTIGGVTINSANLTNFILRSNSTINDNGGIGVTMTAGVLTLVSNGAVGNVGNFTTRVVEANVTTDNDAISIQNDASLLTITASSGGGNVTITNVTGVGDDISVSSIVSGGGAVDITARDSVTVTGSINSGGGNIDIETSFGGTDSSLLTVSAAIISSGGDITIETPQITIGVGGSLNASGSGNVQIFTDSGNNVFLGTAAVVGNGLQLDLGELGRITADTLTIGNNTTGPDILVAGITTAPSGFDNLTLRTLGAINDDGAGVDLTVTGTLTLRAGDAIGGVGEGLDINAAAVSVLTTGGNDIDIDDAGASNTTISLLTGGAGTVNYNITGGSGLLVDTVTTTGTVTLVANTAGGTINDHAVDTTTDVSGSSIDLNANSGIGNTAQLDLDAPAVSADTSSGAISIRSNDADPVAISSLTTGGGTITYVGSSSSTITTLDGSGSAVSITDVDGVTANGTFDSNGGTITIDADSNDDGTGTFIVGNNDTVISDDAAIMVTAADVNINTGASLNSGTANTTLVPSGTNTTIGLGSGPGVFALGVNALNRVTANTLIIGDGLSGAIQFGNITSSPNNITNLTLITGSTINDDDDTGNNLTLTSGTLALTSGGVIGGANAQGLNLNVATLNVTDTGGNAVTIRDSGASNTTISITTGGAGAVNYTQSANSILVNTVSTTAGVTLNSTAGAINDHAADTTTDVTASSVDLNASTGIGNTAQLDLNSPSVAADTTNGAISLLNNDTDAVTVTSLSTGSGAITYVGSSSSTFDSLSGSGSAVTLTDVNGINVDGVVDSNGGAITIDSDSDDSGVGDFIVLGGDTLISDNAAILITSVDVGITAGGSINSGTANTTLLSSTNGTIGLGTGSGTLKLNQGGLALITADTLIMGDASGGAIEVGGLTSTPAGITNLTLISGTTINDDDDTGTNLTVSSGILTLTSGGVIGGANAQGLNLNVATLNVTDTGGNAVTITDSGASNTTISITTGGAGAVNYTQSANDILVNNVSTTAGVTLTSTAGAINDHAADTTTDVAGSSIDLNASTGIGNTTQLDINSPSVAADTTNGAISLLSADTDPVTVTSLSTGSGAITYTGTSSSTFNSVSGAGSALNITDVDGVTIGGTVDSNGGAITVSVTTGDFLISTNQQMISDNAVISVTARDVGFQSNSSLNSGTANTTLAPLSGGTIDLGTAGGTFQIGAAGLDLITANTLIIGDSNSGAVVVTNLTSSPANITNLTLVTGSTINDNDDTGTNLTLTSGTLTLTSGGAIGNTSSLNINATDLSVTDTSGNNVTITDSGASNTAINILTGGAGAVNYTQSANNILTNVVTTTGDVTLTSTSGSITDNNAGTNNITAANLSMTAANGIGASGANNDLDVTVGTLTTSTTNTNQFINEANTLTGINMAAGTGNITLTTGGAITDSDGSSDVVADTFTLSSGGAVGTSSNAINSDIATLNVTSTSANDFFMTDAGTANTEISIATGGAGDVTFTQSANSILVNSVTTTEDVTLTSSAAAINDHGADSTTDISAASIDLNAATGIGNTAQLDISAATVAADTTNGDINLLSNLGSLVTVTSFSSGGSTLNFTGSDSSSFDSISNDGDINLTDVDGITINGTVTSNGGVITIDTDSNNDANGDFTLTASGAITTTNAALNITADDAVLNAAGSINTGTANTTFTPSTALSIGLGTGLGDFRLTDSELDVITANTIVVGDSTSLAISLGSVTPANSNNLTLVNSTTINDDGGAGAEVTLSGTLTLTSGGAIGNLNSGLNTDIGALNVTATGGNNVTVVDTGSANTTIDILTGGAGTVSFTQSANSILTNVVTTTGDVTLAASAGSITDNNAGTNNITAANLTMTAASGIGASGANNDLDVTVGTLTTTTTNTNQFINEADALTALNMDAGTGNITLTAGGSIADADGSDDVTAGTFNLSTNGVVASGANPLNTEISALNVTSTGGNNLFITDGGDASTTVDIVTGGAGNVTFVQSANSIATNVITTTGDVTLTASSGAITDNNGATNNITANDLSLTAASGIGASGSNNALDVTVDTLTTSTTNTNQFIDETNSLTALSMNAGTGNITLSAGGSIADSDGSVDVTANTFNVSSGNDIGTGANPLGTDVSALNVTSTAGNDVFVTNTGSANTTLDVVTGAAGNVTFVQSANNILTNVVTTTGDVTLTASAGAITDNNAGSNNITANDLTMTAANGIGATGSNNDLNVTVDTITATTTNSDQFINEANALTALNLSAGTGDITLTTGGAISDLDGTDDVSGGSFTLTTNGAVASSGNRLATDITSLNVTSTGGNGLFITNDGSSDTTVDILTGGAGLVSYIQSANDILTNVVTTTGNVVLTATSGAIVDNNAGSLNVTANQLTMSSSGDIGAVANPLNTDLTTLIVTGTSGNDAYITDVGNSNTTVSITTGGAGDIVYTQSDNNLLVNTVNTTTGAATLTSTTGSINDHAADQITDVTGASIDLNAATGIGNTAQLEISTAALNADTTNGTVDVRSNFTGVNVAVQSLTTGSGAITYTGSRFSTFTTVTASNNTVTLTDADGIAVDGAVTSGGGVITINADSDAGDNLGTFSMTGTGSVTSSNAAISITADDVNINGSAAINSGTTNTTFLPSSALTIGLGGGAGNFAISDAEIDTVTAATIVIGNASSGAITASAFAPANSNNLTLVTNSTINDDGGAASDITVSGTLTLTSNDIVGDVNGGLNIDVATLNVTSTGGNDATLNDAGSSDTTISIATGGAGDVAFTQVSNGLLVNAVTTTGSATLTATAGSINDHTADSVTDITAGSIDLNASTGISNTAVLEINSPTVSADTTNGTLNLTNNDTDAVTIASYTSGSGPVTYTGSSSSTFTTVSSVNGAISLTDNDGITLNGALTSGGGTVTIDADQDDGDNNGTFTMGAGGSIVSTNAAVSVTADDMSLDAAAVINSGTANTTLLPSTALTIGLGTGAGDFNLTNVELLNVTADTLLVGNSSSGAMTITGVDTSSNAVDLTLQTGGAMTANSLTVGADTLLLGADGISVGSVIASSGTANLISTDGSITQATGGTNVNADTVVLAGVGTVGEDGTDLVVQSSNTILAFSGQPTLFISANQPIDSTLAAYQSSIVPTYIPQDELVFSSAPNGGGSNATTGNGAFAQQELVASLLSSEFFADPCSSAAGGTSAGGDGDDDKASKDPDTIPSSSLVPQSVSDLMNCTGG